MAQKVLVEMIDDIDGSGATETVSFELDGVKYEIDLSGENAAALRDELARYPGHARRVGGRRTRTTSGRLVDPPPSTSDREKTRQIRAWAQGNGHEVSDRG